MRIDIYRSNEQKIFDTIAAIRKQGQDLSPNRLVNLILENIETIEFTQTVSLTLKLHPDAAGGEFPRKKPHTIRKTINWANRF